MARWMALTLAAVAQSAADHQDVLSGDVWITQSKPTSVRRDVIAPATPNNTEIPTGDVWLAPDDVGRTAQPKAQLRQDPRQTESVNTGSLT